MEVNTDGMHNLVIGVVALAVKDYERALRNDVHDAKLELFFKSEWFTMLTGLDGEEAMQAVKRRTKKK